MEIEIFTRAIRLLAEGKPFIRRVFIFGSRAKGTHRLRHNDNDIQPVIEITKFTAT